MADVIVTLSLTRKSGILAAAVSSLARNSLEFKSHRFVDLDDADALQVELMADGEVEDKGALTEVLERIRGVDTVIDIRVDGRSLLYDLPAEDEEAETEPEPEPVEAVEEVPAPKAPDPEPEPQPEPEPLPESRAASEAKAEEGFDNEVVGDSSADESGSGRDDDSGKNPMRRSMMRRRRRFT